MTNIVETIARAMQESAAWPAVFGAGSAETLARASVTALEAAGYAIVPIEPTRRQLEAAEHVPPLFTPSDTYRAMINATTTEEI